VPAPTKNRGEKHHGEKHRGEKDRGEKDRDVENRGEDELVVLIVRTAKALVYRIRSEQPEKDHSPMTVVHGLAARYLVGRHDVTTVELAHYLGITKQSTSEVVATLERTGVVRRAPHPSDGRARVLLLTSDGEAKLDAGRRGWQAIEHEWAGIVGADQLDVVRSALEAYLAADLRLRTASAAPATTQPRPSTTGNEESLPV
jgi:DNA-binding MarR family transcriptional regulator